MEKEQRGKRTYRIRHTGYIRIAKQLGYSKRVIEKLERAKDERECDRIMHDARCGRI